MSLEEAKPIHARWSEVNREFLDFVEREPSTLERASFASIYEGWGTRAYTIQPWPLFLGNAQRREVAGIALGIDRLVKGVVERFLACDPARIAAFYRTRGTIDGAPSVALDMSEDLAALLREEPTGVRSAPSRGDYIETRDGLQCIEFNAGGYLGGIQTDDIGGLYLASPPTARFLDEGNHDVRTPGTMRALFRHMVDDTLRLEVWEGGDFNVAFITRPHEPDLVALHCAETYTRDLRAALAEREPAMDGQVFLCALEDLRLERGVLRLNGHAVHAVMEQHNGDGDPRTVFRAFKMGCVNFYSGPIGEILSDKRNLVLLSDHAGSDEFTEDERELIRRHIPWTRLVAAGETSFRGRQVRLPEALREHRNDLVLKKASSVGGDFVAVGRYRAPDEWERVIARALWEEDWVVQEYLETVPYWFQCGDRGADRHEMVWGLFVFGEHFGGAFLRMHAAGNHGGVVNTRRGSEVGVMLEVDG
jgi:hypothetical protein